MTLSLKLPSLRFPSRGKPLDLLAPERNQISAKKHQIDRKKNPKSWKSDLNLNWDGARAGLGQTRLELDWDKRDFPKGKKGQEFPPSRAHPARPSSSGRCCFPRFFLAGAGIFFSPK